MDKRNWIIRISLLLSSTFLGFFTLQSIMWAVWGAPVHLLHYVALLGCVGLFISAVLWTVYKSIAHSAAVVSLIAIGTIYVPGSTSVIPAHNIIVSPLVWMLLTIYFLSLGLVLLLPPRRLWGIGLFLTVILTSLFFASSTYYHRWKDGEFCRPSFAYFKLLPNVTDSFLEGKESAWFSPEVRKQLKEAGVHGALKWSGANGVPSNDFKVIVICAGKPTSSKHLYYPREGTIIFYFDGTNWTTIPKSAKTYDSFATLETNDKHTMLHQRFTTGGIQGTIAFSW